MILCVNLTSKLDASMSAPYPLIGVVMRSDYATPTRTNWRSTLVKFLKLGSLSLEALGNFHKVVVSGQMMNLYFDFHTIERIISDNFSTKDFIDFQGGFADSLIKFQWSVVSTELCLFTWQISKIAIQDFRWSSMIVINGGLCCNDLCGHFSVCESHILRLQVCDMHEISIVAQENIWLNNLTLSSSSTDLNVNHLRKKFEVKKMNCVIPYAPSA